MQHITCTVRQKNNFKKSYNNKVLLSGKKKVTVFDPAIS